MTGRIAISLGLAALALALPTAIARADSGPVIVIPSRPGVPVIINGRDASYAVVEGDWGLARPGAVPVTVYGSTRVLPNPVYRARPTYHPRYGQAPERGRNEIEPDPSRPLPEPAESFSRSWSTDTGPLSGPAPEPVSDKGEGFGKRGTPRLDPRNLDAQDVPATITDPQTFPQNFNAPVIIDRRRR